MVLPFQGSGAIFLENFFLEKILKNIKNVKFDPLEKNRIFLKLRNSVNSWPIIAINSSKFLSFHGL